MVDVGIAVMMRSPCPWLYCHCGCRDKHKCSQPLTPQPCMLLLNHWHLLRYVGLNNLPKVVTRQHGGRESNLQPWSCKSNALTTRLPIHQMLSHFRAELTICRVLYKIVYRQCLLSCVKVYRSRESALNVEPDVVSTSFGYSEFVAPDAGIVRDFDSDGVEIVRFQLAHIEYHRGSAMAEDIGDELPVGAEPSSAAGESAVVTTEALASIECVQRSDEDNDDDIGSSKIEVPAAAAAHPPSLTSAKSEDSEPNEMQSLMTDKTRMC